MQCEYDSLDEVFTIKLTSEELADSYNMDQCRANTILSVLELYVLEALDNPIHQIDRGISHGYIWEGDVVEDDMQVFFSFRSSLIDMENVGYELSFGRDRKWRSKILIFDNTGEVITTQGLSGEETSAMISAIPKHLLPIGGRNAEIA